MMVVVYITEHREAAGLVEETLRENGLLVSVRCTSQPGTENQNIEILVPESEAVEAYELISLRLSRLPRCGAHGVVKATKTTR